MACKCNGLTTFVITSFERLWNGRVTDHYKIVLPSCIEVRCGRLRNWKAWVHDLRNALRKITLLLFLMLYKKPTDFAFYSLCCYIYYHFRSFSLPLSIGFHLPFLLTANFSLLPLSLLRIRPIYLFHILYVERKVFKLIIIHKLNNSLPLYVLMND